MANKLKSKEKFAHFMVKEIFEEPEILRRLYRSYLSKNKKKIIIKELEDKKSRIKKINKFLFLGCGTSYHAGLYGKLLFEEAIGMPCFAELADEYSVRGKTATDNKTAVVALSQSGETTHTLAAMRKAKREGAFIIAVTNNDKSKIARLSDICILSMSGDEKAVAATKTYVSQLFVLAMLCIVVGRIGSMSSVLRRRMTKELAALPFKIEKILRQNINIQIMANKYYKNNNYLILGAKYMYPTALETALKFKEAAYTHAEGLAAGELKHGPLALVDKNCPVFLFAPIDSVYSANRKLCKELKALKKKVITTTSQGNRQLSANSASTLYCPKTIEVLYPLLAIIPLQLFVYHTAVLKGLNPDRPRHLKKFVS